MVKLKLLFVVSALLHYSDTSALDADVIQKIGNQIWKNEASGREDLLVFWNEKESFPSLGIGHNIWFPAGHEVPYTESFPLLCAYLKKHGVQLPDWLEEALPIGAPWKTRHAFYQDKERIMELRQLLVATVALQAQYMVEHLIEKLPYIIEEAPIEQQQKVACYINYMLQSPLGIYILVDYLNFKGDGLNAKEESKGERWGLLSVLLAMPENLTEYNVHKAFMVCAAKKLLMLIEHSGPDYRRIAFFAGWMHRLSTYNNPALFV